MNRPTRFAFAVLAVGVMVIGMSLTGQAQEDVYSERTVEIGRNLSCPVCEGQTVADSHSRVALEMMEAIEAQVQAGQSDEAIYTYFRARYGDEVLVEPPREGINLALWWVPVGMIALGLGVVALYFRDSLALTRRVQRQDPETVDPELEQLADQYLSDSDAKLT